MTEETEAEHDHGPNNGTELLPVRVPDQKLMQPLAVVLHPEWSASVAMFVGPTQYTSLKRKCFYFLKKHIFCTAKITKMRFFESYRRRTENSHVRPVAPCLRRTIGFLRLSVEVQRYSSLSCMRVGSCFNFGSNFDM